MKNKGLSEFIKKAMAAPSLVQRGKIHGDSPEYSNLSREDIMKVLNGDNKK